MGTCVPVTSQGSPYARFKRALATENVTLALAAAQELPQVNLSDALKLCWILRQSDLYERAVIRWLARFLSECPDVTLMELRQASTAFEDLSMGWFPTDALKRLTALCAKHGLVRA